MRNQVQATPPGGAHGARGSGLLLLLDVHGGVDLSREEIDWIGSWIDMSAIFHGLYGRAEQERQPRGEDIPMPETE